MRADTSNLPGALALLTQAQARVRAAIEAEPRQGLGYALGLLARGRAALAMELTDDEWAAGAHPQGPFVVLPHLTADEAAKVHEALNYVIITERVDPEGVLADLNPLRTAFAEATANRPELAGASLDRGAGVLNGPDSRRLEAPWTPDQVSALNRYQHAGSFHPFTCGRCRDELGTGIGPDSPPQGPFDDRLLVATLTGWICPTCDYTQDWCWAFMAGSSAALTWTQPGA